MRESGPSWLDLDVAKHDWQGSLEERSQIIIPRAVSLVLLEVLDTELKDRLVGLGLERIVRN